MWSDPSKEYRVGIQLKERGYRPVYCYADLHDAKFLATEINFEGH